MGPDDGEDDIEEEEECAEQDEGGDEDGGREEGGKGSDRERSSAFSHTPTKPHYIKRIPLLTMSTIKSTTWRDARYAEIGAQLQANFDGPILKDIPMGWLVGISFLPLSRIL